MKDQKTPAKAQKPAIVKIKSTVKAGFPRPEW